MTAPDVRAFYKALGIELPGWPKLEAPTRCFAQPDAHNRGDRSPSCSVNLASGAWNCHGCGAHGGAYDAALALGNTPRSAMELLIANGLAEPRTCGAHTARRARSTTAAPMPTVANRPRLAVGDADVESWVHSLDAHAGLVRRLMVERAWAPRIMRALQIGFDGNRVTIPIRDAHGHLRGILRYDPFGRRDPKMRAVFGSRLGLIPHPTSEPSTEIILVEGPSDLISARSTGLPAIAVPGTNAWRPAWAQLLAGRRVKIVMDCDRPGRRAAETISNSLAPVAASADVIDLSPHRNDGYDLTDRILELRPVMRDRPNPSKTAGPLLAGRQRPRCAEAEASQWMSGTT